MSEEMYSLALSLQHTEVELYSGRRDVFLKSFWNSQQQQQQSFYGHFPEQPGKPVSEAVKRLACSFGIHLSFELQAS